MSRKTADYAANAAAGWGTVPDWIAELAGAAQRGGLKAAAGRLGISDSQVSMLIAGKYKGDLVKAEQRVRGAMMGETVDCPALASPIGRDVCQAHQRAPFSTSSPQAVRLYRACRAGCRHSRIAGGGDA